jgi:NAD(P)-dependent dehydrogenase (short-subunit alcohol dehydrogenase family)
MGATSGSDVDRAHRRIVDTWGDVSHLVLAAGLNTPQRYWRDQSMEEFGRIAETNLVAPARTVDLVLPGMRTRGDGVVVFVSSYSG